ncbi:MAG: radical SAM protein [Syntrophales bacterium]|nr:radical SAM protein [Syntrophales bacterium]MDD5531296.1 radical SAM protein [Syntrophales bacterium]
MIPREMALFDLGRYEAAVKPLVPLFIFALTTEMALDAIIISDIGGDSLSGSSPLRLEIDGRPATLPAVLNFLENGGKITPPVRDEDRLSWSSAPRLNGIHLFHELERHGFRAELINNYYAEKDLFLRHLEQSPRAVVISTTFIISKQAIRRLVEDVRTHAPGIAVILGGPFVYSSFLLMQKKADPSYETESAGDDFLFLDVRDEPAVDLYIIGRSGHAVLREALKRIRDGRKPEGLPGTAWLDGNRYAFGPPNAENDEVGPGLIPDWSILPDRVFRTEVVPIQASTGCPFKCAYCNFIKDRRLTYVKPLDRLIAELKSVSARGARYVRFIDDNFRLGRMDLDQVCRRLIDEGINLKWMSFIRAGTLKNSDLELLRRAGCVEMQLGLESAAGRILQNMNKEADPGLYAGVVKDLLSAGINASCCFIFGFPGETEETVRRTIQFIKESGHPELEGVFSWSIYPFILAPLSPVYEPGMRKRYDLTGYMMEWKHATMDWKEARGWIKRAFVEIENSGPHYGEENLDLFLGLSAAVRKKFSAGRHKLAKLGVAGRLDREVMIRVFREVLAG